MFGNRFDVREAQEYWQEIKEEDSEYGHFQLYRDGRDSDNIFKQALSLYCKRNTGFEEAAAPDLTGRELEPGETAAFNRLDD
ncbi:MAG: hypothetical protein ABEJ64_02145 [Candidatus Nanohaloarchaea archaeon]